MELRISPYQLGQLDSINRLSTTPTLSHRMNTYRLVAAASVVASLFAAGSAFAYTALPQRPSLYAIAEVPLFDWSASADKTQSLATQFPAPERPQPVPSDSAAVSVNVLSE